MSNWGTWRFAVQELAESEIEALRAAGCTVSEEAWKTEATFEPQPPSEFKPSLWMVRFRAADESSARSHVVTVIGRDPLGMMVGLGKA